MTLVEIRDYEVTRVQTCDLMLFFFSSRRRHTRLRRDWSSDVCSSDLFATGRAVVSGRNLDAQLLAEVSTQAGYPASVVDQGIDPTEMATDIENRQRKHAASWRKRALIGVAIWAPAEALHWLAAPLGIHGPWLPWVMLIASTASMILVGSGFKIGRAHV